jgi:hypothetical protein
MLDLARGLSEVGSRAAAEKLSKQQELQHIEQQLADFQSESAEVSEERAAAQIELGDLNNELAEICTSRTRIQTKKQAMQGSGVDDGEHADGEHADLNSLALGPLVLGLYTAEEREDGRLASGWKKSLVFGWNSLENNPESTTSKSAGKITGKITKSGLLQTIQAIRKLLSRERPSIRTDSGIARHWGVAAVGEDPPWVDVLRLHESRHQGVRAQAC